MLDVCCRSRSVLLSPTLWGVELSSRLDLYFPSYSISDLLHHLLNLSFSLLQNCGRMDFFGEKKPKNEQTMGGKTD